MIWYVIAIIAIIKYITELIIHCGTVASRVSSWYVVRDGWFFELSIYQYQIQFLTAVPSLAQARKRSGPSGKTCGLLLCCATLLPGIVPKLKMLPTPRLRWPEFLPSSHFLNAGSSWKFKVMDICVSFVSACDVALRRLFLRSTFDNMVHLREDQQLVEPTWDGERVTILAGQPFENSGMSQDAQVYSAYGVFPLFCSQSYSPFRVT